MVRWVCPVRCIPAARWPSTAQPCPRLRRSGLRWPPRAPAAGRCTEQGVYSDSGASPTLRRRRFQTPHSPRVAETSITLVGCVNRPACRSRLESRARACRWHGRSGISIVFQGMTVEESYLRAPLQLNSLARGIAEFSSRGHRANRAWTAILHLRPIVPRARSHWQCIQT